MSVTSAPFRTEPRGFRPARFAALLLLALAVTLIATLLLLSSFPLLHSAVKQLVGWYSDPDAPRFAGWLTVAFIVFVPTALLLAMWRFRLRSWWWVGGGWLVVAPILVYLAIDEPTLRHAQAFAAITPFVPDGEKSFAVIMRYGKSQPATLAFGVPKSYPGGFPDPVAKPVEWRAFILANRASLEAEWAAFAPQRAWWAELNAFAVIGDHTPPGADAEIIGFPVFRALSQRGWAIASLQALDGHGDAAIDTLLPILQVGRKMQPAARTLARQMTGDVIERVSLRTAQWILDTAAVSPAARARLAAALAGGGGEFGARRLITVEYMQSAGTLADSRLGDLANLADRHGSLRVALNLLSPFVYNRRACANLLGDHILELQDLAARRDLPQFARFQEEFLERDARPRFKNFMGSLVIEYFFPAYGKILESYWKTEDDRAALFARLTKT
jgi:hypothetical protein